MAGCSISVIIPTYNSAKFIRETIDSVLRQSVLPSEIIVVDDASKDDTVEIVRELARESTSIRLIQMASNTGGPAVPQNVGVRSARTELIATLDHDDLYEQRKLEIALECFERHPEIDVLIHDAVVFNETGVVQTSTPSFTRWPEVFSVSMDEKLFTAPVTQLRCLLAEGPLAGFSSIVFRRSVWESIGGFDPRIRSACDYEFLIRSVYQHQLAAIPEKLSRIRKHQDNLSDAALLYNDEENVIVRQIALQTATALQERVILRRQIYNHLLHSAWIDAHHGKTLSAIRHYLNSIRYGNPLLPCWRIVKTSVLMCSRWLGIR
jgi:glycosyltransferase involved in cell wall biosynthesis